MKKKFIAVYALIGVLALGSTALTSCVDDNESASVTAIRDAKAQQLAAIAALDNAKATYEEAMAKLKDAEAENQLLENDRYAAEIEKLKATYEQEKQEAEQTLITQLQGHQKTLYKNYADAQGEVVEITGQIVNKELQIASVKADTAHLKAIVAEQIHTEEMTIAQETATKEAYQAMGSNSYDELVKQREQLEVEKTNLSNEKTAKSNAKDAAKLAFDNAKAQKVDGGTVKSEDGASAETTTVETPLKTVEAINILKDMASGNTTDPNGSYNEVISMSVIKNGEEIKASEDAAYKDYAYTLQVLDAPAVTVATNELQDNIDAKEAAKGKEDDKAATPTQGEDAATSSYYDYDDITFASGTTAYAKLNYFKEAAEDAQKALEDAQDELKDAQDALEDAEEAEKTTAEEAVTEAEGKVTEAEAAVRKANENLGFANDRILAEADKVIKEAEDLMAEFKAAIASLDENSADYKAYKAAVEALINTEGKAYVAADEEYKAAQLAYVTAVGEYNAVVELVGDGTTTGTVIDINAKIAECDKNIAEANTKIEKYENLLYNNNNYNDSQQAVVAELEAELQDLNDKLAIAEQAEASWKEQLEASLNGTAAPAPETPAEGEETPAA